MKKFLPISLSFCLLLVGCSKKVTNSSSASDNQYEEDSPSSNGRGNGSAAGSGFHGSGDLALDRVLFGFDRSDLTSEANSVLNRYSHAIPGQESVAKKVMFIDGHADERGTDEYNMALGYRRAASVQKFLSKKLKARKIVVPMELKSYGKHRPYIDEHNEEAYRQNRRVEFYLLDRKSS